MKAVTLLITSHANFWRIMTENVHSDQSFQIGWIGYRPLAASFTGPRIH